jgi:hypothetical protein
MLSACVQSQPQPSYYPQQQQQQQQYGYQQQQQQQPYAQGTQLPPAQQRQITINGVAATERDFATLDTLERQWGGRLPSGDYWYDNATGAAGRWGGPMAGLMPAGLGLGGPLPPNASGGGNGMVTNVWVNGRELHQYDVMQLQQLVGQVYQGRWWVDAQGNFGQEGGAALGNLYVLSQQRRNSGGGGGDSYYSKDQNGSVFVGGGCVSVNTSSGSYYGSGC